MMVSPVSHEMLLGKARETRRERLGTASGKAKRQIRGRAGLSRDRVRMILRMGFMGLERRGPGDREKRENMTIR